MARILVVDDENNIRMMVQIALEQSGHEVETAADGPSGLDMFADGTNYDLVLLDQRMPGMEGTEVLEEMKERDPGSRIIMITAFGTIDLAVDAMKAGATDFLRKPFTTETLRGAVLGALMTTPKTEMPVQPSPVESETPEPYEPSPTMYGLTTVNGYYVESDPTNVIVEAGETRYTFSVRHPNGTKEQCTVILTSKTMSDVEALAGRKPVPGEDRLWHALCEHVLSDYLYQHAALPGDQILRIDDIDKSIRNWVKSIHRGLQRA